MSKKMDCESVRELLLDYLNGEISDDERMLVSDHLSGCTACAMEMEALAAAEDKLRQAYSDVAAGVSPSPGVWEAIKRETVDNKRVGDSILDRIASKLKWTYAWRRPVWRVAAAAAAATSVALGVLLNIGPVPVPLWTAAEQQAIDIAMSDPAVQALLAGDGVVYEVIPVSEEGETIYYQIAIVTSPQDVDTRQESGSQSLTAEGFAEKSADYCEAVSVSGQLNMVVDNNSLSVVASGQIDFDCLTLAEIEEAADIAENDSGIAGVRAVNVSLMNDFDADQQSFTDETVVWTRLSSNGSVYFAQVDLEQEKVVKLIEGGKE